MKRKHNQFCNCKKPYPKIEEGRCAYCGKKKNSTFKKGAMK